MTDDLDKTTGESHEDPDSAVPGSEEGLRVEGADNGDLAQAADSGEVEVEVEAGVDGSESDSDSVEAAVDEESGAIDQVDSPVAVEGGASAGSKSKGPIELIEEPEESAEDQQKEWYILKVQVNRERSICDALKRRVGIEGLEDYFGEILVPTEDVREFNKAGKQRVVKRKLYPGYIVVNMFINDDTWFLVRETPGIGDFTGAIGKPAPLDPQEIERILQTSKAKELPGETPEVKIGIKFRPGDRVRVKEGTMQNVEGDVETVDESNGKITVMVNFFGRPTPVELSHWQVEDV